MVVAAADQTCTAANAKRIATDIGGQVNYFKEIPGVDHTYFGFEGFSTEFLQMLQETLEYVEPEEGSASGLLIFVIIAGIVTLLAATFMICYFYRKAKVAPTTIEKV